MAKTTKKYKNCFNIFPITMTYTFLTILSLEFATMVSSFVDNNVWAYKVPHEQTTNNPDGIILYGNADRLNHITHHHGAIQHAIFTPDGNRVAIKPVEYGLAGVTVYYNDGTGSCYDVSFPNNIETDDIEAYAVNSETCFMYIIVNNTTYCVNLTDANFHGSAEFVML